MAFGLLANGPNGANERAAEWQVLFNSDTADGIAPIDDIWAEDDFLDYWHKIPLVTDGRTLCANGSLRGYVELLPLFTDDTEASPKAKMQLFGFSWSDSAKAKALVNERLLLEPTGKGGPILGVSRNLARRLSGAPAEIELDLKAADTFTGEISNARIYAAESGSPDAVEYYVGEPVIFETRGDYAWTPFVSNISTGTLVLLGRVY